MKEAGSPEGKGTSIIVKCTLCCRIACTHINSNSFVNALGNFPMEGDLYNAV